LLALTLCCATGAGALGLKRSADRLEAENCSYEAANNLPLRSYCAGAPLGTGTTPKP
jgi:hypothetical protein